MCRFRLRVLRLGYGQIRLDNFLPRCVERSLRKRRCGLFPEALNRFPNTLGRRLPVGALNSVATCSREIGFALAVVRESDPMLLIRIGRGLRHTQHLAGVVPPAGRRGQRLPVSPIEFNRFVDHIEKTSTEN